MDIYSCLPFRFRLHTAFSFNSGTASATESWYSDRRWGPCSLITAFNPSAGSAVSLPDDMQVGRKIANTVFNLVIISSHSPSTVLNAVTAPPAPIRHVSLPAFPSDQLNAVRIRTEKLPPPPRSR